MLKVIIKYACLIFLVVFLGGFFWGVETEFKSGYFYLSFSDITNIVVNLILAIFIAKYIGNKLNNTSRTLEIKLNGLNQLEIKLEKLESLY